MTIANTTIVVKKSGVPGNTPSSLANGELALNYADGKLYYKSTTGTIQAISGSGGSSNSFATINASGTLVLATSPNDILTFLGANGVSVSACSTSKTVTIGDGVTFNVANSAGAFANAAYSQANNISSYANAQILITQGVDTTQNTNITSAQSFANAAYTAQNITAGFANSAYTQANNISSYANAQILVIAGVDATQNTNITSAQSFANGAFLQANSAASFSNAAFSKANTSVQLTAASQTVTGNISIVGSLSVSGNVSITGNVNQISGNSGQFFGNTTTGFNALYAGIPVGYVVEPDTVFQVSTNYNGYGQINQQNINTGNQATADYVVTSGSGNNTQYYIDMGYASGSYDGTNPNNSLGTSLYPNDGYIYVQGSPGSLGGNLVIGTTISGTVLNVIAGGIDQANIVTTFTGNSTNVLNNLVLSRNPITFTDGTKQNTAAAPYGYSNAAYSQANNISSYANAQIAIIAGVDTTQNTNITSAQAFANASYTAQNITAAFANSAYTQANNISAYANAQILIISGVDTTQNTNITSAQSFANGAFVTANSAASFANGAFVQANNISSYANAQIAIIAGVDAEQNANITSAQAFANAAYVQANAATFTVSTVYDLDDISFKSDGFTNTFKLSYNQTAVSIPSPFNLMVTVSGLVQPAFDYKYDTVWLANVLTSSKGYTIDISGNPTTNGYIKFADCPPQGSQILMRTVVGNVQTTKKVYPFKPLDVMMGY
jgi:hypothetical protein